MTQWIAVGTWFGVGLCFGSLANVVIYRLPRDISIVSPPSGCPACKTRLVFYDLIPIISWALLLGRCRNCKSKISIRYPLVEFTCALLFACMVLFTHSLSAIFLSLLAFVLLAVFVIDYDTQQIPDSLLVFAAIVGVGWVILGQFSPLFSLSFPNAPGFISAFLGILAGGLPLLVIDRLVLLLYKKDGFGYGDVKLMAVSGLFLGWQLIIVAFFIAFISGGAFAVYLLVTGRARRGEYIAFGPFLCGGVIVAIWFGQGIISFMT